MLRYTLLLLALFCFNAEAAISFINSAHDNATSGTSEDPGEPTSTAEDDVVLLFCTITTADGAWTDPADFTEITQELPSPSGEVYLGYKVRGSDAGSGYTCSYSGTAGTIAATAITFRGPVTTDVLAVTYSSGSHFADNENGCTTAASAIGTVAVDDWVVIFQFVQGDGSITPGASSGYTMRHTTTQSNRVHYIQSKTITSEGTETPGDWTHTGCSAGADAANITIALNEAAAATGELLLRRRR